ncbi:MAG: hypothetical protein DME28_01105, partial [Verrucomicrobia bacterium]
MKKLMLIIVLGLGLGSVSAFAHEEDEYGYDQRSHYSPARHNGAASQINHINRMLAHVQGQMARYGADWRTRREVRHISGEVNRVNWEYQTGRFNWYHLRGQIEHIHNELHNVELRLRFRP